MNTHVTTTACARPAHLDDAAGEPWKQHLLALPPYDPGTHLAPGDRVLYQTAIVQARRAGGSTEAIAEFLGRAPTSVRQILHTAGEGNTTAVDHVEAVLRSRVSDGTYQIGDALPKSRQLSHDLAVPLYAVSGAITRLAREGSMLIVHGRGTVVTDPRTLPTGRVLQVRTPSGKRETWPLRLDPAVQRIRNAVTDRILEGTYREGDKIPSVETLAAGFEVRRRTVQKAIDPLRRSGLLYCPGASNAGTYVHPQALSRLNNGGDVEVLAGHPV